MTAVDDDDRLKLFEGAEEDVDCMTPCNVRMSVVVNNQSHSLR